MTTTSNLEANRPFLSGRGPSLDRGELLQRDIIMYDGRIPSSWFMQNYSQTMRMVYGGEPFNEAAVSSSGQVLGFQEIKREYGLGDVTDDWVLSNIGKDGPCADLRLFYPNSLPEELVRRASMDGVIPIFSAILHPTRQDMFAGCASTLICKGRVDQEGRDGISRAAHLVGMTPYGKDLAEQLVEFADKIRQKGLYRQEQGCVLGDEIVVMPEFRGNTERKGIGSVLMRKMGEKTWLRSYTLGAPFNFLGRQMMFLTDRESKVYGKTMYKKSLLGLSVEILALDNGRVLVYTPDAQKVFL